MIKVAVLEGSLREKSLSRAVARAGAGLSPENMSVEFLPNPGTIPHFNQDVMDAGVPEAVTRMVEAMQEADALLIVTPEYNWSIPGALKNAIDWFSRFNPNPLAGKPVAIWTVSPGLLGGARVHEGLRHVLHSQDMQIMAKPEVQVGGAKGKVDVEASAITNPDTEAFLQSHLSKFAAFIQK